MASSLSASSFTASKYSVGQNVVKGVLFRASALLLQFGVFKIFSLIASTQRAFTSYLMFAEDPIQKALFIRSRIRSWQSLIVLGFAAIFAGAGVYDVLLWAVDSPGYISRSFLVPASSVADQLLPSPNYIIVPADGDTTSLDFEETLGVNLFRPGFNFSLTANVIIGSPSVVPPALPFEEANNRIWLDEEGFSMTLGDLYGTSSDYVCPLSEDSETRTLAWRCAFNRTFAMSYLQEHIPGPVLWFDKTVGFTVSPEDRDNPWESLGAGGGTAVYMEVLSVTKGRQRHTFLYTATKVSLVALVDNPMTDETIRDVMRRFRGRRELADTVSDYMLAARARNQSFSAGTQTGDEFSVSHDGWELLHPMLPGVNGSEASQAYTMLRITAAEITLLRSDTVAEPVTPVKTCDGPFMNEAKAGVPVDVDCTSDLQFTKRPASRFLGQLDHAAALILPEIIGDFSTDGASSLNQTKLEWYAANRERITNLLLSRAYITSIGPELVTIEVKKLRPAISNLQILLMVMTPVVALLGWLLVSFCASDHYQASFLANICATNHIVHDVSCKKPGYLKDPPEVQLVDEGEHTTLTPIGFSAWSRSGNHGEVELGHTTGRKDMAVAPRREEL